jgi:predicted TIM-barrel fold metal-dependent hydrolase
VTALADVSGAMTDLDSHEIIPTSRWREVFGDVGETVADLYRAWESTVLTASGNSPDVEVGDDSREISADTLWARPRAGAPSASDISRRPSVLDYLGIRHQLVFPGFALFGFAIRRLGASRIASLLGTDESGPSLASLSRRIVNAHNSWAVEQTNFSPDRVRVVGIVDGSTPAELIANAESLLASGVRVLWISAGKPPGGRSPAHPDIDPLWRLCADHEIPLVTHVGADFDFFDTVPWRQGVALFEGAQTLETNTDPYSYAISGMAPAHFLLVMILGGVFERHPDLRFGVIESGASWVGPLAEDVARWAAASPKTRAGLSLTPSEYLQRNVRVTPYHFEPVERYIERDGLDSVYSFSTDFPHVEGGVFPQETFAQRLAPLGDIVFRKFFVENGRLLFPLS